MIYPPKRELHLLRDFMALKLLFRMDSRCAPNLEIVASARNQVEARWYIPRCRVYTASPFLRDYPEEGAVFTKELKTLCKCKRNVSCLLRRYEEHSSVNVRYSLKIESSFPLFSAKG